MPLIENNAMLNTSTNKNTSFLGRVIPTFWRVHQYPFAIGFSTSIAFSLVQKVAGIVAWLLEVKCFTRKKTDTQGGEHEVFTA